MVKDPRYITVGHLVKDGRIQCFREIFAVLPKSVLAADCWMNNTRFDKLRKNVALFRCKDLFRIAFLLEIDEEQMLMLIYRQYKADKANKSNNTPGVAKSNPT